MKIATALLLLVLTGPLLAQQESRTESSKNILIITCHPDDWEIGMAGTAFLLRDKFRIHVVIASDGELGNTWNTTGLPDPELGAARVKDSAKSAAKIRATNYFLRQKDGGVYADENAVNRLIAILKDIDPAIVFLHWPIDKPDHAAASTMAMMALAKSGKMYNREIYFFEVGNLDHFDPVIYVDISQVWETKKELVRIHERFNDDRFQKMAEETALHHGLSNHCKYAEGFIPYFPLSNLRSNHKLGCSLMGL